MKTELRPMTHSLLPSVTVIEIWHGNKFLGTVVGADGPGIRIISNYIANSVEAIIIRVEEPPVLEVRLEP